MHEVTSLSAVAERRRIDMRSMLVLAVGQRRRRRRALRAAVSGLLLALGGYALWPTTSPLPQRTAPAVAKVAVVQSVGNDATVVARCSITGLPTRVQYLDDEGLVQELARDGRPASLLRSGARIEVLPKVGCDWQLAP